MDIRDEMRHAYYRALFGQLKVNGVNVPIQFEGFPKGQNPDIYGIISTSSNTSNDTIGTLHSSYVTQFTIVAKNDTFFDNNTVDQLAGTFYSVVQPNKWSTGIKPNGFQIVYTAKLQDNPRPGYVDSTGKMVLERIIQIENRIYHQ